MTVFADSSALVKLYVAEQHHEVVQEITEPIVIAAVAWVEVAAAIWRKHRLGELAAGQAATLCAEFAADVAGDDLPTPRFATIAIDGAVLFGAADAVARHPLRACDAIQLAAALAAAHALGGLGGFVAFDHRLRAAAAAEGLVLIPTSEP